MLSRVLDDVISTEQKALISEDFDEEKTRGRIALLKSYNKLKQLIL